MELNFLKSQVPPHFLFNALNSAYQMALKSDPRTPDTIYQLSGLMRYTLYEAKNDKTPLRKETKFIEDYVSLSKIRYNGRVPDELNINDNGESYQIVSLLLIQFVANGFKNGDRKRVV